MNETIYEKIVELKLLKDDNLDFNPNYIRLIGGNLLNDILERLANRANLNGRVDKSPRLKFYVYSAVILFFFGVAMVLGFSSFHISAFSLITRFSIFSRLSRFFLICP